MHKVHAHQQTFPFEQHSPVGDWDRAAGEQVGAISMCVSAHTHTHTHMYEKHSPVADWDRAVGEMVSDVYVCMLVFMCACIIVCTYV